MGSNSMVNPVDDCPAELLIAIREFWPAEEVANACAIAQLESGFDAFAVDDSTTPDSPCGTIIGQRDGVRISAERSVGYFQINSCNFPGWEWQRFYNARHNAGTAHLLWDGADKKWSAVWYFSSRKLGLP
jgi:hypothetical protein